MTLFIDVGRYKTNDKEKKVFRKNCEKLYTKTKKCDTI